MSSHAKPTKDEIIALERSYWDAMKKKDGAQAAALSGKTSLVTGMNGVMSISRDKMGKMTEDGGWMLESYVFDDVEVIVPWPDVAIIAYTVTQNVQMKGKSQKLRAADSSTWVRGTAGWECHAHSEAFLKEKEAT